jgi:NAD-dependent dihydropyrimidine dehydrogenase PreA subunit
MAGLFIDVELDESIRGDVELARTLEQACPVDIYAERDGGISVVEENLDECVLCELCVNAAPRGTVRVRKLYDGTALGG